MSYSPSVYKQGFNFQNGEYITYYNNNIYCASTSNNSIIKIDTNNNNISYFVQPNTSPTTILNNMKGMCFDKNGNMYVVNFNDCTIAMITSDGIISYYVDKSHNSSFYQSRGICIDSSNNLYVTNGILKGATTANILKITAKNTVSIYATSTLFRNIRGISIDTSNNLYCIAGNTIVNVTPSLVITTYVKGGLLNTPFDLCIDTSNNLYVTNTGNNTIVYIPFSNPTNMSYYVDINHNALLGYSGNNSNLFGICLQIYNSNVILYVPNFDINLGLCSNIICKVTSLNNISSYYTNIYQSTAIALDNNNNLNIINNDYSISKINPTTGNITSFITSTQGITGNLNGQSYNSNNICFDMNGNMYVANTTYNTISIIDAIGNITLYVDTNNNTLFTNIQGVCFNSGILYFAASDPTNNVGIICQVTSKNTVTLYIDNTNTSLFSPIDIVFDTTNNMYITNSGNNNIVKITTSKIISNYFDTLYINPQIICNNTNYLYIINNNNNNNYTISIINKSTKNISYYIDTSHNSLLTYPIAMCIDAFNNLYVVNYDNSVVLITGVNTIIKYCTFTSINTSPTSICIDTNNYLYVTNISIYYGTTTTNNIIQITGLNSYNTHITNNSNLLTYPIAICVDSSYNLYVVNNPTPSNTGYSSNSNTIIQIPPSKIPVLYVDTIHNSLLTNPIAMCIDSSNNLYITNNSYSTILEVTGLNTVIYYLDDSNNINNNISGLCIDNTNNLYVINYNIFIVTGINSVSLFYEPILYNPYGICIDSSNNLYIINNSNTSVAKITAANTGILLVNSAQGSQVGLYNGQSICIDVDSNFYVTNSSNTIIKLSQNPCLLEGTLILTPYGEILIENIKVGDIVITADNRKVKVLSKYNNIIVSNSELYVIKKNIAGIGIPNRDLYLSGGHLVKINNKYIHPFHNKTKLIEKCEGMRKLSFYHLELENYLTDFLIANGIEVESYGKLENIIWDCSHEEECKLIII